MQKAMQIKMEISLGLYNNISRDVAVAWPHYLLFNLTQRAALVRLPSRRRILYQIYTYTIN